METVRALCEQLIELKRTEDLQAKLDVFFANNRLTVEEYTALMAKIPQTSVTTVTPTASA